MLKQFGSALERLKEVLREKKADIVRDASIQRFEFTFDIAWKALKETLEEYYNVRCVSPQKCFREAYKQDLIAFDDFWIEMAKKRNLTVHTYKEQLAEDVYAILPHAVEKFEELLTNLEKHEKPSQT